MSSALILQMNNVHGSVSAFTPTNPQHIVSKQRHKWSVYLIQLTNLFAVKALIPSGALLQRGFRLTDRTLKLNVNKTVIHNGCASGTDSHLFFTVQVGLMEVRYWEELQRAETWPFAKRLPTVQCNRLQNFARREIEEIQHKLSYVQSKTQWSKTTRKIVGIICYRGNSLLVVCLFAMKVILVSFLTVNIALCEKTSEKSKVNEPLQFLLHPH